MKKLTVLASCFKAENFLKNYFKSAAKQSFLDFEIAVEAVTPSPKEIIIINKAKKKYPFINLNIHEYRIPLSEAWNTSIQRTDSDLICIWNLDDLRTKDSLSRMVATFNEDETVDYVYGNYTVVDKFKKKSGGYINESERENELTSSMILGPFFMFKRSVIDKIGLFDEQLLSGADFDFAMRLARDFKGKHLDHNLGYYLNTGNGLSTNQNSLQELERTVVEIRYGLDVINEDLVEKAKSNYSVSKRLINKSYEYIKK
ncbi:glycosyltransferase [Acidimicrobiia bacterium]|nr:glycosyltransferase [Acidimicrobiia bacterium]